MILFLDQLLNGLQLGITLFTVAAGLTLVFGIMNMMNLAHGSLFMLGAYFCAYAFATTGSFLLSVAVSVAATTLLAVVLERLVLRHLYNRGHFDQVIATFGLLIFFNELVRVIWGPNALFLNVPPALSGFVEILPGLQYPAYRLILIIAGLLVAGVLWLLVTKTRFGMLIRAGASQPDIISALGVDTRILFCSVFALGAALGAFSGALNAPLFTVEAGMGDGLLIKCLVVLVIGGLGSIRGAFVGALSVGIVDTIGRLLPGMMHLPAAVGDASIYLLMIAALYFRPYGLFGRAS